MEITPDFKRDLWGQYTILHDRLNQKRNYYKTLLKIFEPIANTFFDLKKKLVSIKIDIDPTIPVELYTDTNKAHTDSTEAKTKLYGISLTMKTINEFMIQNIDTQYQGLYNIINNIKAFIENMKTEKNLFNDFKNCLNSYIDIKKIMDKNMNIYHQKMGAAEKSVKVLKEYQIKKIEINENSGKNVSKETLEANVNQLINDGIKYYNIYKDNVNKANNIRKDSIEKQTNLLLTYKKFEIEAGNLNLVVLNDFTKDLKIQKKINETKNEEMEKIIKSINIEKDINRLICNFAKNEKPEEEISFINFESILNFDLCDNNEDYEVNKQTIEYMQERFIDEYPNYNKELEFKKSDLRERLYKLFNKYNDEDSKILLSYINDTKLHYYFLILLSKLRTNNRFQQEEKLIDFLGVILNMILDVAEKGKLYEIARNCIILSQTFYNQKNDVKYFLIEKIKNHKWVKTKEFWAGFIDFMIDKEIDKFITAHPEITKEAIINDSQDISDKMKIKLSELLFSQLLPYVNNMNEFNLGLKNIVYITELIANKYNFLSEEHRESIYGLISDNKEEIEKYKKEFKKNDTVIKKNIGLTGNSPGKSSNNNVLKKNMNYNSYKDINKININKIDKINQNNNNNIKNNNNKDMNENKNKIGKIVLDQSFGFKEPSKKNPSDKNNEPNPSFNRLSYKEKRNDNNEVNNIFSSIKNFGANMIHLIKREDKNEEKKEETKKVENQGVKVKEEVKKEDKKEVKKEVKKEETKKVEKQGIKVKGEVKKEDKKEVKIQTKKEQLKTSQIKDEKTIKKDSQTTKTKNKIDNTKTQLGNPFGVSLKKIPK